MLDHERLEFALDIHARSYKLLKWIGRAIDDGRIPIGRVVKHSEDPTAATDWIEANYELIPKDIKPVKQHLGEFASFFWTYITTSFDVLERPRSAMPPGGCGCLCPMCARIMNASHLKPKKLSSADKRRAMDLMVDRVEALAEEHHLHVARSHAQEIVASKGNRRNVGYSTYGHWLIQRLEGNSDGPAVLALWREIAWNRLGSPIQGFRLRSSDFVDAETSLVHCLRSIAA